MIIFSPSAYAADIVTGLVGWWKFNEGSGVLTVDSSGYGNTGTLQNMANPATSTSGWHSGRGSWGLAFDGINDSVYFTAITSTARTQAGWFYFSRMASARGSYTYLFNNFYQHNANNYIYYGNDYFQFNGWVINTWYHIAITFPDKTNSLGAKMYVNAVPYDIRQQGTTHSLGDVDRISNQFGYGCEGLVDDVRIYNRALIQDDITALYNSGFTTIRNAVIRNAVIR